MTWHTDCSAGDMNHTYAARTHQPRMICLALEPAQRTDISRVIRNLAATVHRYGAGAVPAVALVLAWMLVFVVAFH